MSNMAWAKNRYNDTKGKNLPNHWSEVHPPLQCFGMDIDSLKEDDGVVITIWWSVGVMEEHRWRNGHEKMPNGKLRMRRDRSLRNRVVQFTVLLKVVQESVVVPQSSTLPLVMERQVPSIWCVQKLSRFRKAQYNDKVVIVFLVMQRLCPTIQKEKRKLDCVLQRALWRARLHV